ncbi:MAG: hypothetical protein ACRD0Z_09960 [Acidimicrobiales bacterium]
MAKEQDPRVPVEVEDYLVERNIKAGQMGATIGGGLAGGGGGAFAARHGARRGGERGARRIMTTVEERRGDLSLSQDELQERVHSVAPKAIALPAGSGLNRWAVPFGTTGLLHVVVDVATSDDGDGPHTVLRAFSKEGIISRHPTKRVADEIWAAITG